MDQTIKIYYVRFIDVWNLAIYRYDLTTNKFIRIDGKYFIAIFFPKPSPYCTERFITMMMSYMQAWIFLRCISFATLKDG